MLQPQAHLRMSIYYMGSLLQLKLRSECLTTRGRRWLDAVRTWAIVLSQCTKMQFLWAWMASRGWWLLYWKRKDGVSNTRNLNPSSLFMLSDSNLVCGSLYRRHSHSWGWKGQKASQRMKEKESEVQVVMKMQVHHEFKMLKIITLRFS